MAMIELSLSGILSSLFKSCWAMQEELASSHFNLYLDKDGSARLTRINSVTAKNVREISFENLTSVDFGRRFNLQHGESMPVHIQTGGMRTFGPPLVKIGWSEKGRRYFAQVSVGTLQVF
jgi:hypothetical protein